MKRFIILLLCVILIIVMGVSAYVFFGKPGDITETPNKSGDATAEEAPSEKIDIGDNKTLNETQKRFIDVRIPKFLNLPDFSFQQVINEKMVNSTSPYIKEIEVVADETITKQYKYTVSYERYNNDNYISLVILQNYSTGEGGMRSNEWKDTYTVDVVKNKLLSLADVCAMNNYKQIIVDEVNKQARSQNLNLMAGNGLTHIPETQRFYIKDKKLYIYFEPASIAPYLDGELIFEMPFDYVDGKFNL